MALVTEKVFGPETQAISLSLSQNAQPNPTTELAKDALGTSGEGLNAVSKLELSMPELLNCSQLFAEESTLLLSTIKNDPRKAEMEKIHAEHLRMIDRVSNTLSKHSVDSKRIERNQGMLERSAQGFLDAFMKDQPLEENLKFLASSLVTRTEGLKKVQKKLITAKFADKTDLERELLIHQTLLKITKSAHTNIEPAVKGFLTMGPEHRNDNAALYQTVLEQNTANALAKFQLELSEQNVKARLDNILKGKNIAESIQKDMEVLQDFQKQEVNVLVSTLQYIQIRPEKDAEFKELVRAAQESFLAYTKEAMAYKSKLQEFIAKFKLIERDEAFREDLAFNNKTQAKLNQVSFGEVQAEGQRKMNDLFKKIDKTWKLICVNHSKFYTKLKQSEEAINRKVVDKSSHMYFYSETRIENPVPLVGTVFKDPKYILQADLNAKETAPESYPFFEEKVEVAVDVKKETVAEANDKPAEEVAAQPAADAAQPAANAEVKAEEVANANAQPTVEGEVNEVAVASQLAAAKSEPIAKSVEDNADQQLVTSVV